MAGELQLPDENDIRSDFDAALEDWLPVDADVPDEDALLAIAYSAWGRVNPMGDTTSVSVIEKFRLQPFVNVARHWNQAGAEFNGIVPGDWVIAEGEVFRALMQREVTVLTMPRTAEFEVLLEKLDGTFFGFVADNEIEKLEETTAEYLAQKVSDEELGFDQALRLYLQEHRSGIGVHILMMLARVAIDQSHLGNEDLKVDLPKQLTVSQIIEALGLGPFTKIEARAERGDMEEIAHDVADANNDEEPLEQNLIRCPYCEEENAYEVPGELRCEWCERYFHVDADGGVNFSIRTQCPSCGTNQAFNNLEDEYPNIDMTNDDRLTWIVDCQHCHSGFMIDTDGHVVHNFSIDANCPHCGNIFSVPEPANEPFEVICTDCKRQLIGLSTRPFEEGEVPDTWLKYYNDMPHLWIDPDCSPVYSHDVDVTTLKGLLDWFAIRQDRMNPAHYERGLAMLQAAILQKEQRPNS